MQQSEELVLPHVKRFIQSGSGTGLAYRLTCVLDVNMHIGTYLLARCICSATVGCRSNLPTKSTAGRQGCRLNPGNC